jgi:hypothetical protein
MLKIKQHKFIWLGIIVLGVTLLGMPAVYADDGLVTTDGAADVVYYEDGDYDADSEDPDLVLGSTTEDFVYTPVNPCRIIDTREAGGQIGSNSSRSFFVHGSSLTGQGGYSGGCIAPRGEPRGVHINIAAVNSTAPGYLTVWPHNTTMPLAAVLNYSPTYKTDPISNTFTVKTSYNLNYDISVYAHKQTHVVADVMGYYYDAEPEKITAVSNYQTGGIDVGTTYTTVVSKTVNVPEAGRIVLTGCAALTNFGIDHMYCRFTENGGELDYWYFGDPDVKYEHTSRTHMKNVTAGEKTYAMQCYRIGGSSNSAANRTNLVIQFIKEGM